MEIQTIHLVVDNPDDSLGMPLIDMYTTRWDKLAESMADHLFCRTYPVTVTLSPIDDDWDELVQTGTATLNWDCSVTWDLSS